jgi:hypothetical protein
VELFGSRVTEPFSEVRPARAAAGSLIPAKIGLPSPQHFIRKTLLRNTYWEMWGLPMFDLHDAAGVMMEVNECRKVYNDR